MTEAVGPLVGAHPWLIVAIGELGQAEIAGPAANTRIVEYFSVCSYKATSDEVAWCSAFLCWDFHKAGVAHPASARARDWMDWGIPLRDGILGAVAILKRPTADESTASGWHVGLVIQPHRGNDLLISGNSMNRVRMANYPQVGHGGPWTVMGYRWPQGVPVPA